MPNGLSAALFGGPGTVEQVGLRDPQQQAFMKQLFGLLGPMLEQQQQPFDFDPIRQQAQRGLQTQTIPSIAERFVSMGHTSPERSSGFRGALSAAGTGLESSLAALQSQIGLQERGQQQNLLGMLSQLGMQPSFEREYVPGSPGLVPQVLQPLAQGFGAGLGSYVGSGGNPLAGLIGGLGGFASKLHKLFGGREQEQEQSGGITQQQIEQLMELLVQQGLLPASA